MQPFWDDDDLIHSIKNIESLQIGTTDYCNRKCEFCPNVYLKKSPDMVMSRETLERILDELQSVNYDGRIHLYLNGEPLFDNRIVENIALTRSRFPSNYLYISTNGDLLDVKISVQELFDAGLTALSIMLYDQSSVDRLIKYRGRHEISLVLPEEVQEANLWFNRGGNINVESKRQFEFCELPLKRLYFNPWGDMVLCCGDFKYEVIMGNIRKNSLMEIWLSPQYKIYRIAHFMKRGKALKLCNQCNRIKEGICTTKMVHSPIP